MGKNWKSRLCVCETTIIEIIFVTLTEDTFVVTSDTQGPRKYLHHRKKSCRDTFLCAKWH